MASPSRRRSLSSSDPNFLLNLLLQRPRAPMPGPSPLSPPGKFMPGILTGRPPPTLSSNTPLSAGPFSAAVSPEDNPAALHAALEKDALKSLQDERWVRPPADISPSFGLPKAHKNPSIESARHQIRTIVKGRGELGSMADVEYNAYDRLLAWLKEKEAKIGSLLEERDAIPAGDKLSSLNPRQKSLISLTTKLRPFATESFASALDELSKLDAARASKDAAAAAPIFARHFQERITKMAEVNTQAFLLSPNSPAAQRAASYSIKAREAVFSGDWVGGLLNHKLAGTISGKFPASSKAAIEDRLLAQQSKYSTTGQRYAPRPSDLQGALFGKASLPPMTEVHQGPISKPTTSHLIPESVEALASGELAPSLGAHDEDFFSVLDEGTSDDTLPEGKLRKAEWNVERGPLSRLESSAKTKVRTKGPAPSRIDPSIFSLMKELRKGLPAQEALTSRLAPYGEAAQHLPLWASAMGNRPGEAAADLSVMQKLVGLGRKSTTLEGLRSAVTGSGRNEVWASILLPFLSKVLTKVR